MLGTVVNITTARTGSTSGTCAQQNKYVFVSEAPRDFASETGAAAASPGGIHDVNNWYYSISGINKTLRREEENAGY